MKYPVAAFADVANHQEAILHRIAGTPSSERFVIGSHTLKDSSQDLVELRNAIIVPGGGIIWNGFWINGLDIHYYATDWATAPWRPGDFNQLDQTIDISDSRITPQQIIDGPALFCDSHWASINFGHFVHDLLPYGRLFRCLRRHFPNAVPIISAMSWPSQREILTAVFQFPEREFVHSHGCTLVRQLFLAKRQSILDTQDWTTSFFGLRDARQLALSSFGQAVIRPVSTTTHPLKMFLHRTLDPNAPHYKMLLNGRNFSNIDDLALLLMDAGFLMVEPGKVPIRMIATLISRAHVILGVHGANMGNILFAHPNTRIVEIHGPYGNWEDYVAISAVLNLRHTVMRQALPQDGQAPIIDLNSIHTCLSNLQVD